MLKTLSWLRSMREADFASLHVWGAFRSDDGYGHSQSDAAVQRTTALPTLAVIVLHVNRIAEEVCDLCSRMSDQGPSLGEFQLEFIAQEHSELLLDRLGFSPWSVEPE